MERSAILCVYDRMSSINNMSVDLQALKQKIYDKSKGKASILTLKSGLSVYNLILSNHPCNQEEYGDLMEAGIPFIKEESTEEAHLTMEAFCRGINYSEDTYIEYRVVKYTSNETIRLLHTPNEYVYLKSEEMTSLGVDGAIMYYSSQPCKLFFLDNLSKFTLEAIDHPTEDQHTYLTTNITDSMVQTLEDSILSEYTLESTPILI